MLSISRSMPLEKQVRILTFFLLLALPFALLDIRYKFGGAVIRLSDLYILFITWFLCMTTSWYAFRMLNLLRVVVLFWLYILLAYVLTYGSIASSVYMEIIQWLLIFCWPVMLGVAIKLDKNFTLQALTYLLALVCIWIVLWHWSQGYFVRYKMLGDSKYAFGLFSCLSFFLWMSHKSRFNTFILIIALAFMLLSLERKGAVGFLFAVSVYFFMVFMKPKPMAVIFALTLFILGLFLFPFMTYEYTIKDLEEVTHFLDEQEASWHSNLHRMSLIYNGVQIFWENFWAGTGPKMLKYHMRDFYELKGLAIYTHNVYLDTLIEYGVLGALILKGITIVAFFKIEIRDQKDYAFLALCFYFLLVPLFMANGTTTAVIWFSALGIALGLSRAPLVKGRMVV